jgi:hypothetical protein
VPDRDDTQRPGAAADDEAALAIVARHALHDEELVAALAAGALDADDEAADRARARSFVDRCTACRALHDDVATIGASLRAEASFTIPAPRDFRLSVEDAHRLGGTVITRRVAGGFRALLLGIARPVGASMAALGVVGVLVGSAVLGSAGLGAPQAVDMGSTGGAAAPTGAPAALTTFEVTSGPAEPPKASERTTEIEAQPDDGRQVLASSGATWLLGLSAVVVVAGAALFLVGVRASRSRAPGSGAR